MEVDPAYFRPTEVELLRRPLQGRRKLGWKPQVMFDELARIMVEADVTASLPER